MSFVSRRHIVSGKAMPGRSSSLVAIACSAIRRESDRFEERFEIVALSDDEIPISSHFEEPSGFADGNHRRQGSFVSLGLCRLGGVGDQLDVVTRLAIDIDLLN